MSDYIVPSISISHDETHESSNSSRETTSSHLLSASSQASIDEKNAIEDRLQTEGIHFQTLYNNDYSSDDKQIKGQSIESLALAISSHPIGILSLNDQSLFTILEVTFNSNWFKAKDCLVENNWPSSVTPPAPRYSTELMRALVDMRRRIWGLFTKDTKSKIISSIEAMRQLGGSLNQIVPSRKVEDNFNLKQPVGSESITSDIDISGGGEHTELGVNLFNEEFRKRFGVDSATLFDINIYASDWMFGASETINDQSVTKTPRSEDISSTGQSLNSNNQQIKDQQNETWSLVKIRRNMTEDEWRLYQGTITDFLNGIPSLVEDMKQKFEKANSEYDFFRTVIENEKSRKDQSTSTSDVTLSDIEDETDHFAEEAQEVNISNKEYENILISIKELRLRVKKLQEVDPIANRKKIEELLLLIHYHISQGLTFANEVYATEGAVLHAVYANQSAQKELKKRQDKGEKITSVHYQLTSEQYLQSVNENIGDSFHSLNHNAKNPPYAVYRAGKYIARMCDASEELIGQSVAQGIDKFSELKEIGQKSVEEKKGHAGRDPKRLRDEESFFSKYLDKDISDIKFLLLFVGAQVTTTYKKQLQETT